VSGARQQRREQIGNTIMRLDPDRHMVVKIYGEETTRMIEAANLY
jgi:Flp pilus assembly CpaF family ATPase